MDDRPLTPATRDDLIQALAHGLRFEGRRRVHHADELMARIAAEKLADFLSLSNIVVMRGPGARTPSMGTLPAGEKA